MLQDPRGSLLLLAAGITVTAVLTFAIAPGTPSGQSSFLSPKDGPVYAAMAESAVRGDEFRDPNGERSHKMSPAFPMFIAAFMIVLGVSETAVRVASFASYLIAVAVLHRTTGDLFGRRAGLLVASFYSAFPLVMKVTATYAADNLIVAMFALTIWSVLRATREPRIMVLAGLAAGFLALLRASFLPFLLFGALCGIGWRLHHRGFRAMLDPFYLAGGALFISMNIAWAARNAMHFGEARGDPYFQAAVDQLFVSPAHHSVGALALEATLAALIFLILGLCFRVEMARALGPLRSLAPWAKGGSLAAPQRLAAEWATGLWLAFFLSAAFLVLASAAFLNMEVLYYGPAKVATAGQMLERVAVNGYWRYYLPTAVPLVWLGLMFAPARLTGGGRSAAIAAAWRAGAQADKGGRATSADRARRSREAPEAS
jgi:4-amino-4-deoxy-L-arabinose transferase-like glycosyltransferase